ncbi:DEAD/DEAH box helicase family protein [Caldicoprobacter algeriensis]|uniref:DEAD/DEAH box helicase family protein n=1 Tax=Caldicoprobacter algeriensis TaxID=699281 RepID=UPI00207A0DA5|nr:DEAD/DEAH box helicase family protein [Caldicoprobacter algeriensis]
MKSEKTIKIDSYINEAGLNQIKEIYKKIEERYKNLLQQAGLSNIRCFTGGNQDFLTELRNAIKNAVEIDIIVSFLLESGVRLIVEDLIEAKKQNAKIRIITGRYLSITQPSALYLIKDNLGDYVDLRFFKYDHVPFHPKAYIFEYKDGNGEIFIGSSNISESALTYGIEWNYKIDKTTNFQDFSFFKNEFYNFLYQHSEEITEKVLREYSRKWKKPKIQSIEEELTEEELTNEFYANGEANNYAAVAVEATEYQTQKNNFFDITKSNTKIIPYCQPRGAQIEALYELKKTRTEGFNKGIVVAATGIGKTFLAAFDSIGFKRVLFVAHREEILKQAERTFKIVRPNDTTGFFFAEIKQTDRDIIFASVQTLGKKEYLNPLYFSPEYFDYIIIDEFHHAVARYYLNIIEYFKPRFLLGLTATPERLDNKDVFELCDYNVVYELRLKEAINKGYLVPFRYYGIYDETDFTHIPIVNGKYKEDELEKALMLHKRADLILKNYLKFNKKRTVAFCSSRNHAEFMADYFNQHGIRACAVYSGEQGKNALNREKAIDKLKKREINVIFTVDMFNEGIDVPEIDMVMFLRPTESPVVFLQQLGRGLRKSKGKYYLTVLDFIGNYKKANLIPFLLSGDKYDTEKIKKMSFSQDEFDFPQDCVVDFDFRIIDIFKKQAEAVKRIQDLIYDEYKRIKDLLGYRPMRQDLFKYMDSSIYENMKRYSNLNIFNDYIYFLHVNNELTEREKSLYNTVAHEFIRCIETTAMTKSYKIPLLLAFYNNGKLKLSVTPDDIYKSFKEFYSNPSNGIDLLRHKSTKEYKQWGKKEYLSLSRKNPEKFLLLSHPNLFYRDGELFCLTKKLEPFIDNEDFIKHFKDAILYRVKRYYKERIEDESNN